MVIGKDTCRFRLLPRRSLTPTRLSFNSLALPAGTDHSDSSQAGRYHERGGVEGEDGPGEDRQSEDLSAGTGR